jgi:hypothetical protein
MKKITAFNLGAIALIAPLIAFSQQISEIKTDGLTFNEGSSVKFEISFNGQGRCGLQFNFGDGSTSDFRVEDSSKPIVAIKTYPAKGAYKIEANGKTLIRGLNSFTPCKGNAKIEIAVGQNSDGQQKTESSTSAIKGAPQNNTDQILADAARAISAEAERKKAAEKEQAEAKAKWDAEAPERAKAAAEQARLADARAKEEQAKVRAAEQNLFKANADKGLAFAKDSNVKFNLFKKRDEIQAKDFYFAKSDQANNGAKASTEVFCEDKQIVARITVTDATARLEKIGALGLRGVAAKARINGNPTDFNILLETDAYANAKFSNVFKFSLGRNVEDHVGKREDVCSVRNYENLDSMQIEYGNYNFLKNFPKRLCPAPIGTKVYRVFGNYEAPNCENCKTEMDLLNEIVLQIPTNRGDLILKVPPFDSSISQIIKSCKSS